MCYFLPTAVCESLASSAHQNRHASFLYTLTQASAAKKSRTAIRTDGFAMYRRAHPALFRGPGGGKFRKTPREKMQPMLEITMVLRMPSRGQGSNAIEAAIVTATICEQIRHPFGG
jgi:hypothetical protein